MVSDDDDDDDVSRREYWKVYFSGLEYKYSTSTVLVYIWGVFFGYHERERERDKKQKKNEKKNDNDKNNDAWYDDD